MKVKFLRLVRRRERHRQSLQEHCRGATILPYLLTGAVKTKGKKLIVRVVRKRRRDCASPTPASGMAPRKTHARRKPMRSEKLRHAVALAIAAYHALTCEPYILWLSD